MNIKYVGKYIQGVYTIKELLQTNNKKLRKSEQYINLVKIHNSKKGASGMGGEGRSRSRRRERLKRGGSWRGHTEGEKRGEG